MSTQFNTNNTYDSFVFDRCIEKSMRCPVTMDDLTSLQSSCIFLMHNLESFVIAS